MSKEGYCSFCHTNARAERAAHKEQYAQLLRMNKALLSVIKGYEDSDFLPQAVKEKAASYMAAFKQREETITQMAKRRSEVIPATPEGG